MRAASTPLISRLLFALGLWLSAAAPASAADMAPPPRAAFAAGGLERYDAALQSLIDQGKVAGVVTLVSRNGQPPRIKTFGKRDIADDAPMLENTIFRIASMTKPVTGVALMILHEQGAWRFDDPVTKFIPEFAGLTVLENGARKPLKRTMTMRHLLTHTAGFAYGLSTQTPVDALYREREVLARDQPASEMIAKLAALPLAYQPGERWYYSVATDIQGVIVERISGMSLEQFFRTRIFAPLGMPDTGFAVPKVKLHRVASVYGYDADGALTPQPGFAYLTGPPEERPAFLSGGGGLFSTARDYFRFCQMLRNGGALDGVRILSRASVKRIRSDQLPSNVNFQREDARFGVNVQIESGGRRGSESLGAGTYSWSGAFGTWFWIDPANDVIAVGMVHHLGDQPSLRDLSVKALYSALAGGRARR